MAVINVWRPIAEPLRDCRWRYAMRPPVEVGDLLAADLIYPNRTGQIYYVASILRPLVLCFRHAKRRVWLFKNYDTATDEGPIYSAHRLCRSDASGGSSEGGVEFADIRIFSRRRVLPRRAKRTTLNVARIAVATGKRAARSAEKQSRD